MDLVVNGWRESMYSPVNTIAQTNFQLVYDTAVKSKVNCRAVKFVMYHLRPCPVQEAGRRGWEKGVKLQRQNELSLNIHIKRINALFTEWAVYLMFLLNFAFKNTPLLYMYRKILKGHSKFHWLVETCLFIFWNSWGSLSVTDLGCLLSHY